MPDAGFDLYFAKNDSSDLTEAENQAIHKYWPFLNQLAPHPLTLGFSWRKHLLRIIKAPLNKNFDRDRWLTRPLTYVLESTRWTSIRSDRADWWCSGATASNITI